MQMLNTVNCFFIVTIGIDEIDTNLVLIQFDTRVGILE